MFPNIKEELQNCPTEKLATQLLKNSLSRSLLIDRILGLDLPDAMKISLIKSAKSAYGIERTAEMVFDMVGVGTESYWKLIELIDWSSIESALRRKGQVSGDLSQEHGSESHVYFIESKASGLIKIGRSINPAGRFSAIRTMSPEELSLLGSVPESVYSEGELHKRFAKHRKHGEWFQDAPEIRTLIAEIISA